MANYYSTTFQFPPDVIQHLRQFDSIAEAWERSVDGCCMLWLARSIAGTPSMKGCVMRGAAHAAKTIDDLIASRLDAQPVADDPVVLAYFHTHNAAYAAAGLEARAWPEPGLPAWHKDDVQGQRAYAEAVAEARAVAAEVLRGRRLLEEMQLLTP